MACKHQLTTFFNYKKENIEEQGFFYFNYSLRQMCGGNKSLTPRKCTVPLSGRNPLQVQVSVSLWTVVE